MSKQLEKMYRDIFAGRGVIPCKPVPGFNLNGEFYKMNPEFGKGYCWVYQCNPYVTITIMDQIHYENTCCVFEQPEYICVGYFYSISGEILTPYRRLTSGAIQAYLGKKSEYRMILHKKNPIDSISIPIVCPLRDSIEFLFAPMRRVARTQGGQRGRKLAGMTPTYSIWRSTEL